MSDIRQGVWPSPIDDPYANDVTQPFWDGTAAGHLLGYRCNECGTFVSPPAPRCFKCQGKAFTWMELPGTGAIYSFTVIRHPLAPFLQAAVPYVSAVVELDGTQGAGARLLVNVIDCDPDAVRIGDRVEVTFEKVSESLTVPRFRPSLESPS